MRLYRVARGRYRDDLSGQGSYLYGGRWTSKGTSALYTSTHLSLAVLEIIVQARRPYIAFEGAFAITFHLPDASQLDTVEDARLPADWRIASRSAATQAIGDQRFADGALGLVVPSAILPSEHNVVLNPKAPAYRALQLLSAQPLDVDGCVYGR